MSVVPEFNLMDILFDREAHGKTDEIKVDDKPTFDSYWDNSGNVDFLDSILFNHSLNDLLPSGDELLSTPLTGSVCSDSGLSSDQQMSPQSFQEGSDDLEALGIVKTENDITYPDVFPSESIETSNDCEVVDIGPDDVEIKNEEVEVDVEAIMPESPVQLLTRPVVRVKPVTPISREGSSRSPLTVSPSSRSSHSRPILIPVKGRKNLKTIKIIKAVGQQARFSPAKTASPIQFHQASPKSHKYEDVQSSDEDDSGDDLDSNSSKNVYPRLQLTEEEKRLMVKEGISLPTHYPLTKQEERDLKRIRRKIRNKISAQDSRKRKKEYVDGLEDRVKQCTAENATLLKKMKALQTENQTLTAQLRRLQAVIARNGAQPTQPATCLMVLVLSLALILSPNMRNTSRAVTQNDLSIPDSKTSSITPGRTRTILESQSPKTLENGFQDIPIDGTSEPAFEEEDPKQGILSELAEMLNFRLTPSQHDHDYTSHRQRKRARSSYVVPPVDDKWPPPKRPHVTETINSDRTFNGRRLTTIRSFAAVEPRNRTGNGGPPSPSNIVEIELTSSSDDGF